MPRRRRIPPKRVVYLWGAGATQAEVSSLGAINLNMLMRDSEALGEGISTRILDALPKNLKVPIDGDLGIDIEKLISLLTASGANRHLRLAARLRRGYFDEISRSLVRAKVWDQPLLAIDLLNLHRDPTFAGDVEALSGFITTNHDGLLQVASHKVFKAIDVGMPFVSDVYKPGDAPVILQLHGSFSWHLSVPIRIAQLNRTSRYSESTVWIPPTILKESKAFPFNKLMGRAYELLAHQCDVLRVVGSSLTQNDWNILTLIFTAQRHREFSSGSTFSIELIMAQERGKQIQSECSYLRKVFPIGDLTEGGFEQYRTGPIEGDMHNPFAYWLGEKREYHRRRAEFDVVPNYPRPAAGGAP